MVRGSSREQRSASDRLPVRQPRFEVDPIWTLFAINQVPECGDISASAPPGTGHVDE
jgi:hypothetical protein